MHIKGIPHHPPTPPPCVCLPDHHSFPTTGSSNQSLSEPSEGLWSLVSPTLIQLKLAVLCPALRNEQPKRRATGCVMKTWWESTGTRGNWGWERTPHSQPPQHPQEPPAASSPSTPIHAFKDLMASVSSSETAIWSPRNDRRPQGKTSSAERSKSIPRRWKTQIS